jgi:hypothetical protein
VDPAGAQKLRCRIEEQENWRRADAVRDGRQSASDPDIDELDRVDDGIRFYSPRIIHGELVRQIKRLSGGFWVSGTIVDTPTSVEESRRSGEIARVA